MDYSSDPTSHDFHTVRLKECQVTREYAQFVKNFYAFANIQKACLSRLSSSLVLRDVRPGEGFAAKQKAFFLNWCKKRGLTPDPGDITKLESKENSCDPSIPTRHQHGTVQDNERTFLQRGGEPMLEHKLPVCPPTSANDDDNHHNNDREPSHECDPQLLTRGDHLGHTDRINVSRDCVSSIQIVQDDTTGRSGLRSIRSERAVAVPDEQSEESEAVSPGGNRTCPTLVPFWTSAPSVYLNEELFQNYHAVTSRLSFIIVRGVIIKISSLRNWRAVLHPVSETSILSPASVSTVFLQWEYLFSQLLKPPWMTS